MSSDQGYSGYYDAASEDAMSGFDFVGMGDLLQYTPDLAPVGSKSTYFPRSVDGDAVALTFLGYDAGFPGGGVSQSNDMNKGVGAWDPVFRAAVSKFQSDNGLTVDGWIGPATRTKIKERVDQKNAKGGIPSPPVPLNVPIPPPSPSNQVPVNPAVPGQPQPQPGALAKVSALSTGAKVGIGVGALALIGGLWWAFKG